MQKFTNEELPGLLGSVILFYYLPYLLFFYCPIFAKSEDCNSVNFSISCFFVKIA